MLLLSVGRKIQGNENKCKGIITRYTTNVHVPTSVNGSCDKGDNHGPQVVLTREAGKNDTLKHLLEARGISCLEMPLVETSVGPERHLLKDALQNEEFEWVCVTSPEAALVLMEEWIAAGQPNIRVAVVGKGTSAVFEQAGATGLLPEFIPSVANAEHFGPELPKIEGGNRRILYPASNKAASTLQNGLTERGFAVKRLNTYDTLPVTNIDESTLSLARNASVIAVASPSAFKSWVRLAGSDSLDRMVVACIGSTSARAAEKAGVPDSKIFYPTEPGLETFVESIIDALASLE